MGFATLTYLLQLTAQLYFPIWNLSQQALKSMFISLLLLLL